MREIPNHNAMVPARERVIEMPMHTPHHIPDSDDAAFDPFVVLRRSLRGRMGWVITLSIIAAIVFAIAGYRYEKPIYKSEALVRIAYQLPPIISETDQNAPMAMFESYMRTEALRMSSR